MPFKSEAQRRFLESKSSPLTPEQKAEWRKDTNFKTLPKRVKGRKRLADRKK